MHQMRMSTNYVSRVMLKHKCWLLGDQSYFILQTLKRATTPPNRSVPFRTNRSAFRANRSAFRTNRSAFRTNRSAFRPNRSNRSVRESFRARIVPCGSHAPTNVQTVQATPHDIYSAYKSYRYGFGERWT